MPAFANTQDLVTIKEIRQNTIILKSGRLLQIVMVDGINFSLKSEDEQNVIIASYQNFLNSIEFPLQVVIHSRKINVERYLESLKEYERKEPSALLQSQISEYREFIKTFVKDNPIMTKTFFVIVPLSPVLAAKKEAFARFFPFFRAGKTAEERVREESEANFGRNLAQLEQRITQVIDGLNTVGLEAVRLADQALVELFYNFYNPETTEREGIVIPDKK